MFGVKDSRATPSNSFQKKNSLLQDVTNIDLFEFCGVFVGRLMASCFYTGRRLMASCFYTGRRLMASCFYTGRRLMASCFYAGRRGRISSNDVVFAMH